MVQPNDPSIGQYKGWPEATLFEDVEDQSGIPVQTVEDQSGVPGQEVEDQSGLPGWTTNMEYQATRLPGPI